MKKKIALICFEQFQILDLTGPMEVFSAAALNGEPYYDTVVLSKNGGLIKCSAGLTVKTTPFVALDGFDSLVVVGGSGTHTTIKDDTFIHYIKTQSANVKRVISICTGSFILAKAGLLAGKTATTHWASIEKMASENPSVDVESDALYIQDGNIFTSAGVTAGIDLALSLVKDDIGHEAAIGIAKGLVVFYHRPGGQSQFSIPLKNQALTDTPLQQLCEKITRNPGADLCINTLAGDMNMSPRNFSRKFSECVGISPGKYVEQTRLEAAKQLLETSKKNATQIAALCGFSNAEILRRVFQRHTGITPNQYRKIFSQ